ncbi:hypothetical protein HK096_011337, partial [Nowakowskiella sp. JEL0078]
SKSPTSEILFWLSTIESRRALIKHRQLSSAKRNQPIQPSNKIEFNFKSIQTNYQMQLLKIKQDPEFATVLSFSTLLQCYFLENEFEAFNFADIMKITELSNIADLISRSPNAYPKPRLAIINTFNIFKDAINYISKSGFIYLDDAEKDIYVVLNEKTLKAITLEKLKSLDNEETQNDPEGFSFAIIMFTFANDAKLCQIEPFRVDRALKALVEDDLV